MKQQTIELGSNTYFNKINLVCTSETYCNIIQDTDNIVISKEDIPSLINGLVKIYGGMCKSRHSRD